MFGGTGIVNLRQRRDILLHQPYRKRHLSIREGQMQVASPPGALAVAPAAEIFLVAPFRQRRARQTFYRRLRKKLTDILRCCDPVFCQHPVQVRQRLVRQFPAYIAQNAVIIGQTLHLLPAHQPVLGLWFLYGQRFLPHLRFAPEKQDQRRCQSCRQQNRTDCYHDLFPVQQFQFFFQLRHRTVPSLLTLLFHSTISRPVLQGCEFLWMIPVVRHHLGGNRGW